MFFFHFTACSAPACFRKGEGHFEEMNFQGFEPRFKSLRKTASWNNSFVFFCPGKGGPLWAMDFQGFELRFKSLRKTASWSNSFAFFSLGKGTTLGHGFSRFGAEIQILRENSLLEQFFCLFRPWQGGATLGHGFSGF